VTRPDFHFVLLNPGVALPFGGVKASVPIHTDGAYDGKPTYDAVTRHSADAAVIIPPRANAVERRDTEPARQAYCGNPHRWPDEVASRDRLRQAVSG